MSYGWYAVVYVVHALYIYGSKLSFLLILTDNQWEVLCCLALQMKVDAVSSDSLAVVQLLRVGRTVSPVSGALQWWLYIRLQSLKKSRCFD